MKINCTWCVGALVLVGILGAGGYFLKQNIGEENKYEGLVTTLEVQTTDELRTLASQRIATARASLAANKAAGEEILPDMYNSIANDALVLGDLILARESLESSLQLNSLNGATWSSYGYVLVTMHDYELAKDAYLRALELSPREETYRDAIRILAQQFPEEREKIGDLYKQSVDDLGQKMFNMLGLARWYAEGGDCVRAEDHFDVAEDLATSEEIRLQVEEESKTVLAECKE